jgi:hypothetical protein
MRGQRGLGRRSGGYKNADGLRLAKGFGVLSSCVSITNS